MKKTIFYSLLVAFIITLGSFTYYFGEKHSGNGRTKELAAQAAEKRAQAAADKKKTCITEADLDECKEEKDGTWTCYAYSANHKGSCK